MLRRWLVYAALFAMVVQQSAHAQALLAPVETLAINRAEAAIITRVAASRGFAANDPRIAATLTSMGQVSTTLNVVSTGAGAALAFAGAPVWLTVAAGLGILAVGGSLATGRLFWNLSSDGSKVTVQQPAPTSINQSYPGQSSPASTIWDQAVGMGLGVYHTSSCSASADCARFPAAPTTGQKNFDYSPGAGYEVVASSQTQVQQFRSAQLAQNSGSACTSNPACTQYADGSTVFYNWNADGTSATLWESMHVETLTYDSESSSFKWVPSTVVQQLSGWTISPAMFPVSGSSLDSVYQNLDQTALKDPLDAMTLANITNSTWQRAASQAGYSGLPYSPSQPVSYGDVQPWIQANPTAAPTVGDLLSPAANPASNTVTINPTVQPGQSSNPGTNPGGDTGTGASSNVSVVNTPNVNVVNKVSVDLGADPNVGSPGLESMPTISMILQPLLNLLPDLKSWAVPAHTAQCPQPSIDLFGKTFKMTAQCDLAEQNRTAITSLAVAAFAIAALFIVLTA